MAGNTQNPATMNNVTHFAWLETQTGIEAQGPAMVVEELEDVIVDLSTQKNRMHEGYESGLINAEFMTAAGY